MAIGAALLFNIKLPINFNSPYKAKDIQDFWRRWHITLSRFLKDYIYIPLGGSRVAEYRVQTNLMITFIIGGFWHGAGWTFVFWGFLHGAALIIHRVWKNIGFKMNSILAWFITFNFINITWIFFRAKEWDDAIKVLGGMLGFNGIVLPENFERFFISGLTYSDTWVSNIDADKYLFLQLFIALFIVLFLNNSMQYLSTLKMKKVDLIFIISISVFAILNLSKKSEFLYFNF